MFYVYLVIILTLNGTQLTIVYDFYNSLRTPGVCVIIITVIDRILIKIIGSHMRLQSYFACNHCDNMNVKLNINFDSPQCHAR